MSQTHPEYKANIKNNSVPLSQVIEFEIPSKPILEATEKAILKEAETFKMAGFREGKAPMNIVKKKIGPEILSRTIEQSVDSVMRHYFESNKLRPAMQPQVEVKQFDDKNNLCFEAKIEFLPEIPALNYDKLSVEVLKIEISDEDLKKSHEDIVKNFKNFDAVEDTYESEKGDAVLIDFVGKIDDKEFEGGKGEGVRVEIGANQFIPGFEDQLIGLKSGDSKTITVTFPADYHMADYASKVAVFDVKVNSVMTPESFDKIDDAFAVKMGLENLEQLNELIRSKIQSDYQGISRLRTKKLLFDQIDSLHKFDVPPSMFSMDFDSMWNEIKSAYEANPSGFEGKSLADLEKEYKEVAARRVRLGILLADIAREAKIEISEEDIKGAIFSEIIQRPGQESIISEFYKNPENQERLKGPLLEEKAVDYILTKIKKEEKVISSKDFFEQYASEIGISAA